MSRAPSRQHGAGQPHVHVSGYGHTVTAPPGRDRVQQVAADLAALAHCVLTVGPIAARGVAEANMLLSDGCGPLYNRRNCEDLPERVRSIVRDLDPLSSM